MISRVGGVQRCTLDAGCWGTDGGKEIDVEAEVVRGIADGLEGGWARDCIFIYVSEKGRS